MASTRSNSIRLLSGLAVAAALAVSFLPSASAGSADNPEVQDAADGSPAAPWGDLLAIWLDNETLEAVDVHIQVVEVSEPPQYGEVGARLLVGDKYTLVGSTTIPEVVGVYQGGFHCPGRAEDYETPNVDECGSLDVRVAGNALHLTVPRALLGAGPGAVIGEIVGYAELITGPDGGLDEAGPGRTYAFEAAPPTSTAPGTSAAPPPATTSPAATAPGQTDAPAPTGPGDVDGHDAFSPGVVGVGLAVSMATLLRTRRNDPPEGA